MEPVRDGKMIPEDVHVCNPFVVAVPPPAISGLREIPRLAGLLRSSAGSVTARMEADNEVSQNNPDIDTCIEGR